MIILSHRYHHRPHHDHTDGQRPLLSASSLGHQSSGCLLLDLLCVCVCRAHRVRLRPLQRRLQTQREGQGESQQVQL